MKNCKVERLENLHLCIFSNWYYNYSFGEQKDATDLWFCALLDFWFAAAWVSSEAEIYQPFELGKEGWGQRKSIGKWMAPTKEAPTPHSCICILQQRWHCPPARSSTFTTIEQHLPKASQTAFSTYTTHKCIIFYKCIIFFWGERQDLHLRCSCVKILPRGSNSSHLHFSEPDNYFSVDSAAQNQILNRADWIEFLDRHAGVDSLKFLNSSLLWRFQVALIALCSPMRWMIKHSETSTISTNWKNRGKQLFFHGGRQFQRWE